LRLRRSPGTIFTESPKPFEVEIVVAEVGAQPSDDQIYRITFDGSVTDEPGFVAFGGQADQAPLGGHAPAAGAAPMRLPRSAAYEAGSCVTDCDGGGGGGASGTPAG